MFARVWPRIACLPVNHPKIPFVISTQQWVNFIALITSKLRVQLQRAMATTEEKPAAEVAKEAPKPAQDEKPAMSEEETIDAVVERLKFFFSDANIRQDLFIRKLLLSDEKSVKIEDLLRFNTIKQYTTDAEIVKKAAEKVSDFLTVKEGSIGRVNEFTKELLDKNIPVSLVVGNLPCEIIDGRKKCTVTVDDLKALFEGYGPLALIKLRYGFEASPDDDLLGFTPGKKRPKGPRVPLGSALVEFEATDALEKAAEETLTIKDGATVEPKRKLKIGESELTVTLLKEYLEVSKKRKAEAQENEEDEEEKEELPTFTVDWKPGCVIRMEGLSSTCDREQILESVAKCLDKDVNGIKEMNIYVDFSRGQNDGCIRFQEPDLVSGVLSKLSSGDVEVAGAKVEKAIILEGDEEKQYWQDFMDFKTKQMRQRHEGRRHGGGGRRKKFRRRN